MTTPYFEDISREIERRIYHAKSSIKIAVAYFTSQTLFNALLQAVHRRRDVTLIISEEESNFRCGLVLHDLINAGGKVLVAIQEQGMMHHKFCIVDDETVITGSFNWTEKASHNLENICVIEEEPVCVTRYHEEFEKLEAAAKVLARPGAMRWIESGVEAFDAAFMGFASGTLTILSSQSQEDITSQLLTVTSGVLRKKSVQIAYLSLSGDEQEFSRKLLSVDSGVNRERIRRGTLTEHELISVTQSAQRLVKNNTHVVKMLSFPSAHDVLTNVKLAQLHGAEIIVVDGLNSVDTNGYHSPRCDYSEYERVLRELRQLARSLNVPIIVGLTINVPLTKRKETIGIGDFGALYDMAGTLFYLYRSDYYSLESLLDDGTHELTCVKHYSGQTSDFIKLVKNNETGAFGIPESAPFLYRAETSPANSLSWDDDRKDAPF